MGDDEIWLVGSDPSSNLLGGLADKIRQPGSKYDSSIGGAMRAIEVYLANVEAENPTLGKAWSFFGELRDQLSDSGSTIPGVIDTESDRRKFIDAYYEDEDVVTPEDNEILERVYEFVTSQGGYEEISTQQLKSVRGNISKILSDPTFDKKPD
ncbi:MAG: hypothetical protein WAV40_01245 [Microgenomates group bacterium]